MKQDQQDATTSPDIQEKPVKSKLAKRQKNYYEPYVTPRILYEMIRLFAMVVFSLTLRLRLRGLQNVPRKGPFIIAANHLDWTDVPLIVMHVHHRAVYMAKEEYFMNKKMRWLVRFMGSFPVKRGEADRQALRTAEEQIKKGNMLVIFPEGTRSRTYTMARAHSGMGMIALRTGVPVVPVAIWGSEKVFKKFRTPVTISYGQPIVLKPKGNKITREDIDEATETIMHKIAEMLPPQYRGVYGATPGK